MKRWIPVLAVCLSTSGLMAEDVDFEKSVLPILEKSCFRCHGPKKDKGDLRLHTVEAINAGKVLVAGKPGESELIKRILLPEDDEDRMPPSGKPLTKEQTTILSSWVAQGAKFGSFKGIAVKPAKKEIVVSLAKPEALEKIRGLGALALPLAQNTNLINVDFRATADKIADAQLDSLAGINEQLTWLNLARTKITDGGLAKLKGLKNLTRLHLEKTAVGDAGLAHIAELGNIEYLNLYGTQVTDKGLEHLKGLKKLKKLFVWQSKVTYAGSKAFQKELPGVKISLGWDNPGVIKEKAEKELASVVKQKDEAGKREEAAKKEKDEAAKREEAAKKDKEAASKREEELKKKIAELAGKKPEEAKKEEGKPEKVALVFKKGSCCDKAQKAGGACKHPCCVAAAKDGKVCKKCNG